MLRFAHLLLGVTRRMSYSVPKSKANSLSYRIALANAKTQSTYAKLIMRRT